MIEAVATIYSRIALTLDLISSTTRDIKNHIKFFTIVVVRTAHDVLNYLPLLVPALFVELKINILARLPCLVGIEVPFLIWQHWLSFVRVLLERVTPVINTQKIIACLEKIFFDFALTFRYIRADHPWLVNQLITLWVQLIPILVNECHFELVIRHAWILTEVETSHTNLFAIELAWSAKDNMFDSICSAVCTGCDVMITLHITRLTIAATARATRGAIAMPYSASTLDLNVQIRSSCPLKDHIHTNGVNSQFITKLLE